MVNIIKGTIDDLPELVALDRRVFAGVYDHEPYGLAEYQEKLAGKDAIIYLAKDGEKVIGDIIAYERDDSLYIWIMAVDKDYRGQGIGKKFFANIEKEAKTRGLSALTIKTYNVNQQMLGLLIKLGFQIYDFIPSDKDIKFNAIRLIKNLNNIL